MEVDSMPVEEKDDTCTSNPAYIRVVDDRHPSDVIIEGKAEVTMLCLKNVFYNPVQEFNRDLSVAVLSLFAQDYIFDKISKDHKKKKHDNTNTEITNTDEPTFPLLTVGTKYEDGLTILEALSASGLRSIRYAKEIPGIKLITANDLSESAVQTIDANIVRNNVDHLVCSSHDDACMVMYKHRKHSSRFQAIDLDPYGCPSQFLDPAMQCISDGGLLLVTCTDMGVLAGNTSEACYSKYGAISLKIRSCHELALRIVLQCLESHANRHGRYIEPLLSISADFYVRVFVKVHTSPATCKKTLSKLSMVYQCVGCETLTLHPLGIATQLEDKPNQYRFTLPRGPPVGPSCEHCSGRHTMGGPVWSGPLHDVSFVSRLEALVATGEFGTKKRMQGLLAVIKEELPDVCLYYTIDKLFAVIHAYTMPMLQFRSALLNAGYRVSYSHAHKSSVKTDAPPSFLWDILRTWVKEHPVKPERLTGTALAILSKAPTAEVNFTPRSEANPRSRLKGLARFPANPQPHWGPGTRAGRQNDHMEKSRRNQGRFKRNRSGSDNNSKKCIKTECEAEGMQCENENVVSTK